MDDIERGLVLARLHDDLTLAELGDFDGAIISAQKSLRIATDLEKDEFVRMNEKNIKKWKAIPSKN